MTNSNQTTEPHDRRPGDAWQRAIDFGIDVAQLEYLLTLTPHERIERHDRALELVRALRAAGREHSGFDLRYPEAPGE